MKARCHLSEFTYELDIAEVIPHLSIPFLSNSELRAIGLRDEMGFDLAGRDEDGAWRYESDLTEFMKWVDDNAHWVARCRLILQDYPPPMETVAHDG